MNDKFFNVVDNKGAALQKRLVDNGDGTYAERVSASADIVQAVPGFRTSQGLLSAYGNFSEVSPGDFVTRVTYSNGQVVTALSAGPLVPGESRVVLDVPVYQPCALEVEGSVIRNRQQFATLTLFSNGDDGLPAPVPDPINIVSIYQSSADNGAVYSGSAGTVVTVNLETALPDPQVSAAGVYLSDWVHINGLVDSRLNYQNACIKYISPDRKQITFGFSDEAALPTLAIATVTPTLGTAKLHFYNNMGGASDGFGLRFTGTTATSAAFVSVFGDGDAQASGTLFGDQRATIASSAPQYLNGIFGNVEIKATSRYRLEARPSEAAVLDKAIEGISAVWAGRVARTAVKPSLQYPLRPRFRVYQPVGMSRPTDEITAISKAGTTTATVTHTGTRTYQVNEVVGIYGVRDITNFPQATGTITAVLSATQFQLVLGSAVTATSYGGSVCITNGGAAQPGIIGQNAQTVRQSPSNTEWLEVIGNTTWSGLSIGDYINMHGVRDSGGVDLAVCGAWEVAHLSTTTLLLKPITDILGVRVSPAMPALGTVALNCGGSVILRTTLRIHDLMLEEWSENKVMIDGQGTSRADKSIPVSIVNASLAVSAAQGTAVALGTNGAGAWTVRSGAVRTVDVASAAITATSTGSAIDVTANNGGQQFTFDVTAVSGTSPRMYPRIQESFDGGINWVTTFDLPPCVNSTDKTFITPPLPVLGTHYRSVRTLTGTTPSFTNSVTRTSRPMENPPIRRQLVDRIVSLTATTASTDFLYVDGCKRGQIVLALGAATTAPTIKLQVCDDIQANAWYDVPGATVAGTASATVASAMFDMPAAKFARLVPTVAGSGITADTYTLMLKAW